MPYWWVRYALGVGVSTARARAARHPQSTGVALQKQTAILQQKAEQSRGIIRIRTSPVCTGFAWSALVHNGAVGVVWRCGGGIPSAAAVRAYRGGAPPARTDHPQL